MNTPPAAFHFNDIGRLPEPVDNVAITTHRLEAGSCVTSNDGQFEISHTIMEGHRFAIRKIAAGEDVLSWGLPFGTAIRDIEPGDSLKIERQLQPGDASVRAADIGRWPL